MNDTHACDDDERDSLPEHLASLRERTPADVERQVLVISATSSVDEVFAATCAADWLMARAKSIHRLKNEVVIAWIDHNGEFDIGNIRYSVGYSTSVRCLNVPQAGHAILAAAGGDFEQFMGALVAQPYKAGTVRNMIGTTLYGQMFVARRTGRLVNGVPERVMQRTDRRFVR
jgi:hypothetical protein